MRKKIIALSLAGALVTGGLFGINNVFAADNTASVNQEKSGISEHLKHEAQRLGINVDGKTKKEVRKEVHQASVNKKKENLFKKAERLGISTNGKSAQEVRKEVKSALQKKRTERLNKVAQRLGINTDGKSFDEIKKEIKDAQKKKKEQKQQTQQSPQA